MDRETNRKLKIGVTCGDPNGIGPEVIMQALSDQRLLQEAVFIVFSPTSALSSGKKEETSFVVIKNIQDAGVGKINVVNYSSGAFEFIPGSPTPSSGSIALWSLESGKNALEKGLIDAVVTAPVAKHNIQLENGAFMGQTEFFGKSFSKNGALMMLCSTRLKVALATTHIPIKEVPTALKKEEILSVLKTLDHTLRRDFNVARPKIAVLGLNPHAGESGNIGMEELEIISPAISAAKNQNLLVFGPYSADGFFGSQACFQFDAILAMYHDQGLTAFKALSFDESVNYTAGLSMVRTSPGHGTAFDLVGTGKANPDSMRNAIYMALDVCRNRKHYDEATKNPLKISKEKFSSDDAE